MAKSILQSLSENMARAMTDLQDALRGELSQQGHVLTGRLRDSIEFEVRVQGDKVIAVFLAEGYGMVMETGIAASRIPYGGRTGRGGKSQYIEGLVRFFELRGRTGREALSAAFATAAVHKREGLPARGSFAYTQNSRRTGFVRETLKTKLPSVGATIVAGLGLDVRIVASEDLRLEPLRIAT